MGNVLKPPQTSESDLAWGWGVLVISTWIALIGITAIIIYTAYEFYLLHKFRHSLPLSLELSSMASFIMSWIYVTYQFLTWGEWFTSGSDCKWILDVLIILLSFTKCTYYWFLTVRLQVSFDTSVFAIKRSHLWVLRIGSIIGTLILAALCVQEIESPKQYSHDIWGLYCGQLLPIHYAIIYGAYDGFISGVCVYCFVSRLSKVAQSVINFDELIRKKTGKSAASYHSRNSSFKSTSEFSSSASPTPSTTMRSPPKPVNENQVRTDVEMIKVSSIDTAVDYMENTDEKEDIKRENSVRSIGNIGRILSIKSREKLSTLKNVRFSTKESVLTKEEKERLKELRNVKRDWKKNNKLFQLGKIHTTLTIISVVSTQVVFGIGFTLWPPATFIIMLDTLINCICFLCMFRFVHLTQRISIAGPICWIWCCWPFNNICYSEEKREKLFEVEYKYKVSMNMIDKHDEKYQKRRRKKKIDINIEISGSKRSTLNIGSSSPTPTGNSSTNYFPSIKEHKRIKSSTSTIDLNGRNTAHHCQDSSSPATLQNIERAISDFDVDFVDNTDIDNYNHLQISSVRNSMKMQLEEKDRNELRSLTPEIDIEIVCLAGMAQCESIAIQITGVDDEEEEEDAIEMEDNI